MNEIKDNKDKEETIKHQEKLEAEIELTIKKIDIIIRHKENVRDACERLGRKLIKQGQIDFGLRLIAAGWPHDNSKFFGIEWDGLLQKEDKELLKQAINNHQLTNRHHPQFHSGIGNMNRSDLAELVCDLYARAIEFGTNLRDFIKDVYAPKHNLTPNCKISKIIKEYVDLLLEEPFKELK